MKKNLFEVKMQKIYRIEVKIQFYRKDAKVKDKRNKVFVPWRFLCVFA